MRLRLSLKAPWKTSQDSNHLVDDDCMQENACMTAQENYLQLSGLLVTLNTSEIIVGAHGHVQHRAVCHGISKPHKDSIGHRSHHSWL